MSTSTSLVAFPPTRTSSPASPAPSSATKGRRQAVRASSAFASISVTALRLSLVLVLLACCSLVNASVVPPRSRDGLQARATTTTSLTNFRVTIPTTLRQCERTNLTFTGSSPSVAATRNLTVLWVVSNKVPSTMTTTLTTLAAVKALNATVLTLSNISVADKVLYPYTMNITNGTTVGLFAFYADGSGLYAPGSARKIALPGPGAIANCIVPTCKTTEFLQPSTNQCFLCSQYYSNSTSCSLGTGALTCSYGVPTITTAGSPAQCKPMSCVSGKTLSADGTKCLDCSGATGCDSGCTVCPAAVEAKCSTGYYQVNFFSSCTACSTTFKNSTTCTSSGATACSYGVVTKVNNVNQCVAVSCPSGQYSSSSGTTCTACSLTFPNATTCSSGGAITCSYGIPTTQTSGLKQCAAISCPIGSYPNSLGTTCVSCSTTYPNSTACTSTGATACSYGVPTGSPAQCKQATCTSTQYLTAQGTCLLCSTAFPNATSCSLAGGALTCSSGTPVSTNGAPAQCLSACLAATYRNASGICAPCPDKNASTCNSTGKSLTCSVGTLSNGTCTVISCSGATYLATNGSTCLNCTDTNAASCDSTGKSLTCKFGVLNSTTSLCSKINCAGTPSYASPNGSTCIPCGMNVTSCDATGAKTCSYGVPSAANCSAFACSATPPSYLNPNGTACIACAANATTCSAAGATSCSYGVLTGTNPVRCAAPNCTTSQLLNANATACSSCPSVFPNSTTCTASGATACSYGVPRLVNGISQCVPITCNTTQFANVNASACADCVATFGPGATTCSLAAGALTCSYGVPTNKPAQCSALACNSSSYSASNGTQCIDCASQWPNSTACTAQGATACSWGVPTVNTTTNLIQCVPPACDYGQFLTSESNGTQCGMCQTLFPNSTFCTEAGGATGCQYGVFTPSTTGGPATCVPNMCDPDSSAPLMDPTGVTCMTCSSLYGDPNVATCNYQQVLSCSGGYVVDPTTNNTCVNASVVAGYTCQTGDPLALSCTGATSTSCLAPATVSNDSTCSLGYAALAGGPDASTSPVLSGVSSFYDCIPSMPCADGLTMMFQNGNCYCQALGSFNLTQDVNYEFRRVILPGSCASNSAAMLASVQTGPLPGSCLDFGYVGSGRSCLATYAGLAPVDCSNLM